MSKEAPISMNQINQTIGKLDELRERLDKIPFGPGGKISAVEHGNITMELEYTRKAVHRSGDLSYAPDLIKKVEERLR
jgi:hypothetical protein